MNYALRVLIMSMYAPLAMLIKPLALLPLPSLLRIIDDAIKVHGLDVEMDWDFRNFDAIKAIINELQDVVAEEPNRREALELSYVVLAYVTDIDKRYTMAEYLALMGQAPSEAPAG